MEYSVHRYTTVQMNSGKSRKKFNRKAVETSEFLDIERLISLYQEELKNTVFSDSTTNPFESRQSVIRLLEQHICNHIIKVGRHYYKQKVGIPQGSVISSILCSLYYGFLEREKFSSIVHDPHSCLIRYIDDFLFITTDIKRAKSFMEMMHKGFIEYGAVISPTKSLVNFEMHMLEKQIDLASDNDLFPWCGLLIHTTNLHVLNDFTKINETRNILLM